MAAQNFSAALRMTMPNVVQKYLRHFELQQRDSGAQICVTVPAPARLGALEVAPASVHDTEFSELGAPFRHSAYFVERTRRLVITER